MSGQLIPGSTPFGAVTRVEVIDHIGEFFTGNPVTRSDLISAAERVGARPAVVELLGRLPDHKFTRPNELWTNLTDVPIES
jgi:hypothetical protein